MLASIDVTGFVENVDFVGVEGGFGADGRHTSGPKTQTQKSLKVTDTLVWGVEVSYILMNFYHSYCIYPRFNHHSFHCFNTVMVKITKAAPLCHMHRWRCQGPYRHSGLCRYPETYQNTRAEGPDSGWGFSETNKGYQCHNCRRQATKKWRTTKEPPLVYQISWPILTCENCFLNVCFSPLYM